MSDLKLIIEEKIKQLQNLGREITRLQKTLQEKQTEALKLDGAISALKELKEEPLQKTTNESNNPNPKSKLDPFQPEKK